MLFVDEAIGIRFKFEVVIIIGDTQQVSDRSQDVGVEYMAIDDDNTQICLADLLDDRVYIFVIGLQGNMWMVPVVSDEIVFVAIIACLFKFGGFIGFSAGEFINGDRHIELVYLTEFFIELDQIIPGDGH